MNRFFNLIAERCLHHFSKTIHIDLEPGQVVFRLSDRTIQTTPHLFVGHESGKLKILGFGTEETPAVPHLRIDVFNFRNVRAETPMDPEQCLTAFFSTAFRKALDTRIFVRPHAVVSGIHRLTAIFPENKETYLKRVLLAAGARGCEILKE